MIETIIQKVLENPSQENKIEYEKIVSEIEYNLLIESEKFPHKSQEKFSKRTEAFSFRRNCAIQLISKWVEKYNTTENCPVSYADTLNIPFREIKNVK